MKKLKWPRNMGLKAIALLFAAILWLAVVNIAEPVESMSFSDIPVEVINEEVVTNTGKTYDLVGDTQSVRVTVTATRSVLSRIHSNNIVATADLSQMEGQTYLVPITASVRGIERGIVSTEVNPRNVQVKIEDVTRNTFPIAVSATGTPRDGYTQGEMKPNPEKITIGGTESAIRNIHQVVARVDISGRSENCTLDAELIIYDGNGNQMDQSQMTNNLGDKGLSVDVEILNIKSVPLSFSVSGEPAPGFIYDGCSSEPAQIRICGSREALAEVNEISIPPSELRIDGESSRKVVTVNIQPYLPEGISLADDNANNVVVTILIEQEGVKTIALPVEAIRINNLQSNLRASFESDTDLELQFTGDEDILAVLDIRYSASIDLRNYKTPGTYEVPVNIENISDVKLMTKPTVKIVLTEKEEE